MHTILISTFMAFTLFSCSRRPIPIRHQSLRVNVASVKFENIQNPSVFSGKVILANMAEIRPQVRGVVIEHFFQNGDFVKKGDKLFLIKPSDAEGSVDIYKANLFYAKTNLQNQRLLLKVLDIPLKSEKAVLKNDRAELLRSINEAKAEVALAEVQLQAAEESVRSSIIYSPISGQVTKSEVGAGELIDTNRLAPLAVVRTLDPIYVEILIAKGEMDEILGRSQAQNMKIDLKFNHDHVNYPHSGQIHSINGINAITLRAVVPNPDGMLLAGMTVLASFNSEKVERKLVIPESALIPERNDFARVWVMETNHSIEPREVRVAPLPDHKWKVISGLNENDMVVLDHLSELSSGDRVLPRTMQAQEAR
jgi:membrane fusion protein (multidrug efflux system)